MSLFAYVGELGKHVYSIGYLASMPNVIMGNGGFYGCLIEPQDVSAW